jgi:peptide chain release factor subunit 1
MAISLYIPEGKDKKEFLKKELDSASNIKDRVTRKDTTTGLKKIIEKYEDGMFYLWDGNNLWHSKYAGKDFIYKCGTDLYVPKDLFKGGRYGLVCFNHKECTIGELRGKKIVTLWHETSNVPGKQDSGGQSAPRFQRIRQDAQNKWYKKIADKMKEFWLYE